MGVMACSRNGCENVMCDRYSHKYGHICNECFDELVRLGTTLGMDINIDEFMTSPKKKHPAVVIYDVDPYRFFANIFPVK